MPRLIFIAVLLGTLTGCSSQQYFKGIPTRIAPIANTESFYVIDAESGSVTANFRDRSTLTRLDPDGSITVIREIDKALLMSSNVCDGSTVVMYDHRVKQPVVYTIATGELSPTADKYKQRKIWEKVEGQEFDSLTKIPFLKDLVNPVIYRLYKKDHYLIQANISRNYSINGGDTFAPGCFVGPPYYWAIADMKNSKIILRIEDAMPDMSATGRTIFFSVMPPYEKCYPYIVSLEDYLK
jgi:hypothetical protein